MMNTTLKAAVARETRKAELESEPPKTLKIFDIISKFFIGVGGLVLSAAVGFSTINFSRQATERQASIQIGATVLQRRTSTAQLELSLMPALTRGSDSERQLVLSILASVDPEAAGRIATVVIPQLKSAVQQHHLTQIVSLIPEKKRQQEFRQRMQNAAIYRQFSLDANACREYFAAFDTLSAATQKDIAKEREMARGEYSRGKFTDAAGRLQAALETNE